MYILVGRGLGEAPSCTATNCSAISVDRFDKQPADLRMVLAKSFKDPAAWFARLPPLSRFALTAIFNRLCRYRVWCHVNLVLKIAAGEPPVMIADRALQVPGSTPSVYFTCPDRNVLTQALMSTGRFCIATGVGASQHAKQTTLREISGSDSLHVSLGPGNQFDAHIDKYSPVPEQTGSSFCSNRPTVAALTHIGRELVPEIFRKITRVPGVQLFPDFELTPNVQRPEPATRQDADLPPPPVGITWRW